ncbi:hypothetical protein PVAND_011072 [Polypedilum vanderplanki]|uniref:BTB domain-containing protein n=1 Tax=Polypedilum vanderplanki TaxID=319348 RepID=A0A9J6CHH6_POLVA|nr:hypothetical protein PVAND_011072 [Polypedilum vanderplanki]
MMPWMVPYLRFSDDSLKSTFQEQLSLMRKNRLFCDVILHVENTEIPAHRNVLACVSPYLMELFSAEQNTCNDGNIPSYRLNGYITKEGLNILVEYAYTAQLEVPEDMIKDVYLAAWQLRMERVVNECSLHLVSDLSTETAIDTRSLPGINRNKTFVKKVDSFISDHFPELLQTTSFLQLPSIQIEVLHQTKEEMAMVAEDSLCRLVLEWTKREISDHSASIASLSERSRMLFLALDNSLQDVSELIGDKANSDMVKDYKSKAQKNPSNIPKTRRKCLSQPERPRILLYSREVSDRNDEENREDADWNVIASIKVSDHTYISLVTLNGALCRVSIQLRLNVIVNAAETSPPASNIATPSPAVAEVSKTAPQFDKQADSEQTVQPLQVVPQADLFCEIATMSESKCGLGVGEHNGKLIVVGGYGRTECLKSTESYCPVTNKWTEELSLSEARGRVQIAIINEVIYAVGGSNGVNELDTVECLSLNGEGKQKWKKCAKLPFPRSNCGVCAFNGKLYCIGGNSTGQNGIRQCDVYDPETNKWTSIAPLNTGRCQAGVVAYKGKLYASGGSDAWNCLNSVEVYDPEEDVWTFAAPLLTARRGCGLTEYQGKIYCIGGSDGSQSLKTTEYYDDTTQSWILGPSLISARANVSVAVIQNRLYAVGGFNGKKFLNTIEYFDEEANEWTKFAKLQAITAKAVEKSETTTNGTNGHHNYNHLTDSEEEDKNSSVNGSNESLVRDLKQKVTLKVNEKDKIREDESEATTIIMPL